MFCCTFVQAHHSEVSKSSPTAWKLEIYCHCRTFNRKCTISLASQGQDLSHGSQDGDWITWRHHGQLVRKTSGNELLTLSAATEALTEELAASKHRDTTKCHPRTQGAELLHMDCWNRQAKNHPSPATPVWLSLDRDPFLSTSVTGHS